MYNHAINRPDVKFLLLDAEIRAAGIAGFTGLSKGDRGLVAHFESKPTKADLGRVDAVVTAHDPAQLTRDEQAAAAAQAHATALKTVWYQIVTADPTVIETALTGVQTKLTEAQTALQSGDTATGITKMLEAQAESAQLGQTAMQHILVLTRVLREVMRRSAPDILTDPEEL